MTQRRKSTAARRVGEAPVVEDLEKEVPDGCRMPSRTRRAAPPRTARLGTDEIKAPPRVGGRIGRRRSSDSGLLNSLMSRRIIRSGDPKRNSASALAISVLPVPVGPTKRKTPSGRRRIGDAGFHQGHPLDEQWTASGCPSTRASKNARTWSTASGAEDRGRTSGEPRRGGESGQHVGSVEAGAGPGLPRLPRWPSPA